MVLTILIAQTAQAATWAGRTLSDILAELRASGIPLIYSNQIVTPALRVNEEPAASTPLDRLREALRPLGLTLKYLGSSAAGYAIVRNEAVDEGVSATSPMVPSRLREVTVYASRYSLARENETDSVVMRRSALEHMIGSEQDALRSLRYLPGTTNNGVSALTHVRGGNEDETLVQFDGVELYNPVHLKDFQGLFGLLDAEFVQSLDFFSGGYPARYGNHTSGMVDIAARENKTTETLLGVSMLYTRAISSGSFDNEQGTWLFGYRNSSLPEVLRRLRRKIGDPAFEDYLGRVSYDWQSFKLTAGALRLNDDLQLTTLAHAEQTTARYRDTYLWLRAEHNFSDSLAARVQLSRANLTSTREATVDVKLISNGLLNRTHDTIIDSLSMDWSAKVAASTSLEWGAHIDRASLRYDYTSHAIAFDPLAATFHLRQMVNIHLAGEPRGDMYNAYISARTEFDAWSGELGLRWDDYDYIDHSEVVSPRLNLSYALNANSTLRFGAGRYVQARGPNNLDITSLASRFSSPESSDQYVLGFERRFEDEIRLRIESYTKHSSHVRQYSENILDVVTLAPELKIDRTLIAPRSSSARGVEISIASTRLGPANWWASYTWSQTLDRLGLQDIPRSFDQPHALSAGFQFSTSRWHNSAALTWHTGWPYRPLQINSSPGNSDTAKLGIRNSERFGDFASLDLRTQYQVPIGTTTLELYVEAHNALNRANDCCQQVTVTESSDSTLHIQVKQKLWLGIVPLAGVDWRF